jgi:uncharacterized protein
VKPAGQLLRRWWAALLVLVAAILPVLVLLPLGAAWLWQRGWLIWWLAAAAGLGVACYAYVRWLRVQLRREQAQEEDSAVPDDAGATISMPDPQWSGRDMAAWRAVTKVARGADGKIITDHRLMLDVARQTIEVVAAHYHPEQRDPVWRFTLPEILLLTERVSARVRQAMLANVPGSHLIRIGQIIRMWEFKPAAERGARVVRGLAVVFRAARMVNPVGALVAEVRGQLFSMAMGEAGDHLRGRGVRIWVEEVGRAAIDLYSGRMRIDQEEVNALAAAEGLTRGVEKAPLPGPLRVIVAGQVKVGKSSLVNALLEDVAAAVDILPLTAGFSAFELRREGLPEAILIDSPGLDDKDGISRLVDHIRDSDCVLWVVAAHRADRALDRAALDEMRARFHAEPQRIPPPVLVVVTHVDRLSPAREWSPPYNIDAPARAKELSIRAALDAIAGDLAVANTDLVPVRLDPPPAYNVDVLWAELARRIDRARRSRALRIVFGAPRRDWRRVLRQAGRAGLVVSRRPQSSDD